MSGHIERPLSALLIDPHDYEVVKKLGTGASGSVYLVKDQSDQFYALKEIKVSHVNLHQQQYFFREIEVMARAVHPALLRLNGYSLPSPRDANASILMEYMPRGSVLDMFEKVRTGKPPADWDRTHHLSIIFGIAGGIRYLHQRKIIHRDLKADNILLSETLEPRIADFGLSKLTLPDDSKAIQMTGKIGTPLYMAPELFEEKPYDSKVDVYAFGMLTYEILSGETPFPNIPNPIALGKCIVKGTRPPIPQCVPGCWAQLIERCWAQDPASRPTFDEIVMILSADEFVLPECDQQFVQNFRDRMFAELNAPAVVESKVKTAEVVAANARSRADQARALAAHIRFAAASTRSEVHRLAGKYRDFHGVFKRQDAALRVCNARVRETAAHVQELSQKFKDIEEIAQRVAAKLPGSMRCPLARRRSATVFNFGESVSMDFPSQNASKGAFRGLTAGSPPVPRSTSAPLGALMARECQPLLVNDVVVTGNSKTPSESLNLAKLLDPSWTGSWFSAPEDAYVCFEFQKKGVCVASYRLKSCAMAPGGNHLMDWVLEGQTDGTWAEIHTVKGDGNLNGELKEHTYTCPETSPPYRSIRIRQIGPNHSGRPTGFGLSGVQLFGLGVG
jgi:serine/threonine protein kinase